MQNIEQSHVIDHTFRCSNVNQLHGLISLPDWTLCDACCVNFSLGRPASSVLVTGPRLSNKYDVLDGFDDMMFEDQSDSTEYDE